MISTKMVPVLLAAVLHGASTAAAYDCANLPPCRKFSEIYTDGKTLCEKMWDDAFEYTLDESKAFTPDFDTVVANPNVAVADALDELDHISDEHRETCHLKYFHHANGTQAQTIGGACPQYDGDEACCAPSTVASVAKLKEAYGPEYHWDRCGPLSAACEAYFVSEACLYECEPAAGHYRITPDHADHAALDGHRNTTFVDGTDGHNQWQLFKMPISGQYCDGWFEACKDDLFCGSNDGSYFSCAAEYEVCDDADSDAGAGVGNDESPSDDDDSAAMVAVSAAAGLAGIALAL